MDSQTIVYVVLAGVAITSFGVGRWWTIALPFVIVPGVYLGLDRDWWGTGLGDGWEGAMGLALTIAVALAAAGVLARALARRALLRVSS